MGGTSSSHRVIEYVDRALEALVVVFCANGAAVEVIMGRYCHIKEISRRKKIYQLGGCTNQR